VSEPLERIIRTGEAEYWKRFRTGIWVPITVTVLFSLVAVGNFFYGESMLGAAAYAVLATFGLLCLWVSRGYYASWKAEEAKLNLALRLMIDAAPEDEDEPDC
jgi:Flp pilus assembly protein TadB